MFIWPRQPRLCWNCGDVGMRACLSRESRVDGGKVWKVELNASAELREGCTWLITLTVGCVIMPLQTPVTEEISSDYKRDKQMTRHFAQHFSSYMACLYRVTFKVEQRRTVYAHLLHSPHDWL